MTRAKRLLFMYQLNKTISDTFARVDSATLGNAETGQSWNNIVGTFGVASGVAIAQTADSGGATESVINLDSNNCIVSADIKYASGNTAYLEIRSGGASINNKIYVFVSATAISLRKNINATVTTLGTYTYAFASGSTKNVKISAIGNNLNVYLDNVLIISVTDDNVLKENTYCGIYAYKYNSVSAVTFDNFNAISA